MFLKKLTLTNFKNYTHAHTLFHPKTNLIVGNNGMGKTNILDAIYYTCHAKSYFTTQDQYNTLHQQPFFRIEALFQNPDPQNIVIKYDAATRKKEMLRNQIPYAKLSEHIGLLPATIIAPDDILIVKEGSEPRRKLLDISIAQYDKNYLNALIQYEKIIQHRNQTLKNIAEQKNNLTPNNKILIHTYNQQLEPLAHTIFEKRTQTAQRISPLIQQFYTQLAYPTTTEKVQCTYKSDLQNTPLLYSQILDNTLEKDLILQRTTKGIHTDDLLFEINTAPQNNNPNFTALKKIGSQGQQKTFLIALKLALYNIIAHNTQTPPILLLDDIFDKLDAHRTQKLLELIHQHPQHHFGQIFITDTQLPRLTNILNLMNIHNNHFFAFQIENGNITQI